VTDPARGRSARFIGGRYGYHAVYRYLTDWWGVETKASITLNFESLSIAVGDDAFVFDGEAISSEGQPANDGQWATLHMNGRLVAEVQPGGAVSVLPGIGLTLRVHALIDGF
jgi:hypothetical protein